MSAKYPIWWAGSRLIVGAEFSVTLQWGRPAVEISRHFHAYGWNQCVMFPWTPTRPSVLILCWVEKDRKWGWPRHFWNNKNYFTFLLPPNWQNWHYHIFSCNCFSLCVIVVFGLLLVLLFSMTDLYANPITETDILDRGKTCQRDKAACFQLADRPMNNNNKQPRKQKQNKEKIDIINWSNERGRPKIK